MSAATPISSSTDKKPYEPSMEEILASIRRIIADDQSLPGHGTVQQSNVLRAPVDEPQPLASMPRHEQIDESWREPDGPGADERLVPHASGFVAPEGLDDRLAAARQHGSIAAPQFATPDGPVGDESHTVGMDANHDWSERPVLRSVPSAVPAQAEHPFVEPPAAETEMPAPAFQPASIDPHPLHSEAKVRAEAAAEASFRAAEPEQDEHPYDAPLAAPRNDEPLGGPTLFSAATDTSITSAFNMLAASRLADNSDELMTMVREMIRPLLRSWLDDNLPSMVERMVRAEIERVARGGR